MISARRLLLLLVLIAAQTAAQPLPGDWIVGDGAQANNGGLFRANPLTGALTQIAAGGGATSFYNGVQMAADNLSLAGLTANNYGSSPGHLTMVAPNGAAASVIYVGNNPSALDLDQDGRYLVSAAPSVYRVNPGPPASSTLFATSSTSILNGVCIDQDTGDTIMAVHGAGQLRRRSRITGAQTVIATGIGSLSGVDFEPRTGSFIVSRWENPAFLRVSPAGAVTAVTGSSEYSVNANAVKVDDETGNLFVCTSGGYPYGRLGLLSPTGAVLRSFSYLTINPTGLEIYGSRKVSGSGSTTAGSTYTIRFAFPSSPGAPYLAALSLSGLRPGFLLPDGRRINLDSNDPLVYATLGTDIPGVTTGFSGTLDGTGRWTATILVPPGTPPNVRVFVSAVALNAGMSLGLDTANTWAFSTN